jgi:ATP-binding protein involved in chromosome partitioning
MALDKESVRLALTRVAHPTAGRDLVAAGAVKKIAACDGYVSITLAGGGLHDDHRRGLMQQAAAAVRLNAQQSGDDVAEVHVEFTDERPTVTSSTGAPPQQVPHRGAAGQPSKANKAAANAASPQDAAEALPGIRHAIAVGAGKGGVGKSSVAVALAVGLARRGHAVGLMDGDIYGPSLPTMLGLDSLEQNVIGNRIQPFLVHGVKAVTIGKMVDPERPLVWRGPMAHGAFKQLLEQTDWGELDYLIIDLPPGTGDISLTMAQSLRLTGGVVVCTPQKVAQDDAVRAARMFQQLGIDVLGVVENMSYFICEHGTEYDIFGRGGAEQMAQRLNVPFLGAIPINPRIRENADRGQPLKNFEGDDAGKGGLARDLESLVTNFENQVALASMRVAGKRPTLKIS